MNELRNPKGYTALINPNNGKMELALAYIPMPGDRDYKETGPERKLVDLTSALDLEAMKLKRRK